MRARRCLAGPGGRAPTRVAAYAAMLLLLGGCGQSGPLRLPDKASLEARPPAPAAVPVPVPVTVLPGPRGAGAPAEMLAGT